MAGSALDRAVAIVRAEYLEVLPAADVDMEWTESDDEAARAELAELRARPPRMAGAREACEILGVSSGNLYKVAGLPEPAQELASGKLWLESDLRALARRRRAR